MKSIQLTITFSALAVAFVHVLFPELVIDAIVVTLLAIAIIPWLGPLFKAIELPGGLKVEYQDLLKAEKKAEDAGLLASSETTLSPSRHVYTFESVVGSDPNLALVGLRIEIESHLRNIASSQNVITSNYSVSHLLRELRSHGYLTSKEMSVIQELLPLLNRAAHGADVDDRASNWALDIGTRLLRTLEERQGETSMPTLLERWRNRDGGAFQEVGTELSKAFVKSPLAFLKAMREDSESFSAWLDSIEQHTLTIFEAEDELENDLYGAYYEKLKSLMQQAATDSLVTDCRQEAQQVLDALQNIEVRRIW